MTFHPLGIVQPVMTDGVTLGRPRCAVCTCRDPLGSNRHRFCPIHFDKHGECAVRTCSDPVVPGSKMCANPQHHKMESLNKARSKALFQIAKRMQRLRVSHPNHSMLEDTSEFPEEEVDDLEENIESGLKLKEMAKKTCGCIMSITQEGSVQMIFHLTVGCNIIVSLSCNSFSLFSPCSSAE